MVLREPPNGDRRRHDPGILSDNRLKKNDAVAAIGAQRGGYYFANGDGLRSRVWQAPDRLSNVNVVNCTYEPVPKTAPPRMKVLDIPIP
jgi:hypothetical protein